VLLADILKPRRLASGKYSSRDYLSPFDICKYKANVRVVDYFPPKIEDFAVGRRPSEFDMLSDYSGGEDTDPEEDMRAFRTGKGFPKRNWEWRFALQVVDATDKASTEPMWLMVGNYDAHTLLSMDATK
jgi:protection-of-telomeres protein 1